MTLPGNRIFVDTIKDLEVQSSWIEGGPKSNAWCFYKVKGEGGLRHTDTEKQGRRAHVESGEDGSRDGSDAATSQGTPRPPEIGRGKKGASETGFQESKRTRVCWFKLQPYETNTPSL